MKALTICCPYSALIMLPESDARHKRVENRNWNSKHLGPLLIHSGKSRNYLDLDETGKRDKGYDMPLSEMKFGFILGTVEQVGSFRLGDGHSLKTIPAWALEKWPWLKGHQHVEGPWCHVYQNPRLFENPIPYRGALGYFDVPDEVVLEQLTEIHEASRPKGGE